MSRRNSPELPPEVIVKMKKPERNKSAFIHFSQDARIYLNDSEDLNSNEMMVRIAELWKKLSLQEKERYKQIARADKERYIREFGIFSETHLSTKIIHNRSKNHIKKPCSAYALFLKSTHDRVKEENPGIKMADVLKKVGEMWKNICPAEKAVLEERAMMEKSIIQEQMKEMPSKTSNQSSLLSPNKGKKKINKFLKNNDGQKLTQSPQAHTKIFEEKHLQAASELAFKTPLSLEENVELSSPLFLSFRISNFENFNSLKLAKTDSLGGTPRNQEDFDLNLLDFSFNSQ